MVSGDGASSLQLFVLFFCTAIKKMYLYIRQITTVLPHISLHNHFSAFSGSFDPEMILFFWKNRDCFPPLHAKSNPLSLPTSSCPGSTVHDLLAVQKGVEREREREREK